MEEKKSSHPHKKKYGTVWGWMLHNLFMFILFTLLAWFLLMAWFSGEIFFQNIYVVSDEISAVVKSYMQFISMHNPLLLNKATSILLQIQNTVQQGTGWLFTWIDRLLQAMLHSSLFNYQQTISAIAVVVFGVIELVVLRLFIFILNVPLILCLVFLAIVDGLGQRDVRKHQGSRESTFFFHRIKPLNAALFYLIFLVYMSMPLALYPTIILVPMAIILSVSVMLSVKSYKKYV